MYRKRVSSERLRDGKPGKAGSKGGGGLISQDGGHRVSNVSIQHLFVAIGGALLCFAGPIG